MTFCGWVVRCCGLLHRFRKDLWTDNNSRTVDFIKFTVHKAVAARQYFHKCLVSVILSMRWGCIPACTGADTPLDRHPPAQFMPGYTYTRHPVHAGTPPPPPAATVAYGTHPTGMHSCLSDIFRCNVYHFLFFVKVACNFWFCKTHFEKGAISKLIFSYYKSCALNCVK